VHLIVADNGTGMDSATLARAFEPLFTTKEIGRGTGLGLATVRAIVTQNGGNVSITSDVDRGTSVHVVLPALDEASKVPVSEPRGSMVPRGTEVVLLVEDDPGVRSLCDNVLRSLGYTVVVASPGEAARTVEGYRRRIDLLVTDVIMPGVRGPAVAAMVRASSPEARVLYVSGYPDEMLGRADGAAAFLAKPFTPRELARKVRDLLDPR
jgi:CheY-like chemotaxis protein